MGNGMEDVVNVLEQVAAVLRRRLRGETTDVEVEDALHLAKKTVTDNRRAKRRGIGTCSER